MFCCKCGSHLPDDARFCCMCGLKVQGRTDVAESRCDREIINTFKIGDNEINFTSDESREILVRSIFEQNADKSSFYLRSYGYWKLDNFEDVYGKYYDLYGKIIDKNLIVAIKTLLSVGINSYDKKTILNSALEKGNVQGHIEEYFSDMTLYEEKVNKCKENGDVRKKYINPWRGGGFGLSGAIKGAVLAGVLNVGVNVIRDLEDGIIDSFNSKKLAELKNELFESKHAVDVLGTAMYELICDIGKIVYEIMVSEGKARKNSWWDYSRMMSKRNNIMDLYNEKEIDYATAVKELCQCFQKYPFAIYVLDDFYDINNELFLDVMYVFDFCGTTHYWKRRHFGVKWVYSKIYFETIIWDENNQMPELWDSSKVLNRLKTNDLCVKLDNDTKKTQEELFIKQGCSLIAVFGILNGAKVAYEGHSLYDNTVRLADDDQFFKLPLTEMMVYDYTNVFDAIDFLFEFLGNTYETDNFERIKQYIFSSSLEKIYKKILELLENVDEDERTKVMPAFRESLFGKKKVNY